MRLGSMKCVTLSILFAAGAMPITGCAHHHHRYEDDRVVVVDHGGFRHEGYYDEHRHWRGGYYDEHHDYHGDSPDWHR